MRMDPKWKSLPGRMLGDPIAGFLAFVILALTAAAAIVVHLVR